MVLCGEVLQRPLLERTVTSNFLPHLLLKVLHCLLKVLLTEFTLVPGLEAILNKLLMVEEGEEAVSDDVEDVELVEELVFVVHSTSNFLPL